MVLKKIKEFFKKRKKSNEEKKKKYEGLLQEKEKLKQELEATKQLLKKYELEKTIIEDYEELKKTPVFVFNPASIYKEIRKSEDPRSIFILTENLKKVDLDNIKKQEENLKKLIFHSIIGVIALSLISLFGYVSFKAFSSYNPPVKVVNQYVLIDKNGNILGVYTNLEEAGINNTTKLKNKKVGKQNQQQNPIIYTPPGIKKIIG